jgi:DNA-binding transcriptional ArsR family regulator
MEITCETLEKLSNQFKVLGDKTRLKILMLLKDKELPVNKIVEQSDTSQANISKHLKILYENDIVKKRNQKSSVLYSIKLGCIFEVCEILKSTNPAKDPPKILDKK